MYTNIHTLNLLNNFLETRAYHLVIRMSMFAIAYFDIRYFLLSRYYVVGRY